MHGIGDVLEAVGAGVALDGVDVAEQLGQLARVLALGLLDDGAALADQAGGTLDEGAELLRIDRKNLADDHQFLLLPLGLGLQGLERGDVAHGDHQLGDQLLLVDDRVPVQLDQLVRPAREFQGQLADQQVRVELVHHRVFADDGRHRRGDTVDHLGVEGRAVEHEVDEVAVGDLLGLEDGLQVGRVFGVDQAVVDDGEQALVHVGEHVGDVLVLLLEGGGALLDLLLQGAVVLLDHLDHADVLDGGDQRARHRGDELVVAVGEVDLVDLAGDVHHADQDVLVQQRHAEQGLGLFLLAGDVGAVAAGVGHEDHPLRGSGTADNAFAQGEGDGGRRPVHLFGRQEGLGLQFVVLVEQVHRAALDADLLAHGVQHQVQGGVLVPGGGQGAADAVELGQVDHLLANRQAHRVEVLRGQHQQDDQHRQGALETEADAVGQFALQAVELGVGGHQHLVEAGHRLLHRGLGIVELLPGGLRLGQLLALVVDQVGLGLELLAQGLDVLVGGVDIAFGVHRLVQRHHLVEPEHRAVDDEVEILLGAVQALQVIAVLQLLGGLGHPCHQRVGLVGEALGQGQVLLHGLARGAGVDDVHEGEADVVRPLHHHAHLLFHRLLGHQHR